MKPWMLVAIGIGLALFLSGNADASALVASRRDPQSVFDAVATLNPASNPIYQPGYNGGLTWCNKFIADVLGQLGISFPGPPTLADDQIAYLNAGNDGWTQVADMGSAQAAALAGQIVIATYFNPNGPGHMALVLPIDGPLVYTAQAGQRNWNQGLLLSGFGSKPVQYFAHS